jgi:hypothetical protein
MSRSDIHVGMKVVPCERERAGPRSLVTGAESPEKWTRVPRILHRVPLPAFRSKRGARQVNSHVGGTPYARFAGRCVMELLYPCCCGLDVHRETVVACVRRQDHRRKRTQVRSCGTNTSEILELHRWLTEEGCTRVAMESTEVFWQPVFNLLEARFVVILANAQHIKAVPGRKTDVKDCESLADLLAHSRTRTPDSRRPCGFEP